MTELKQGVQFSVVITEGRPDETGRTMARALDEQGIPVTAILDSGVAYAMSALRCWEKTCHRKDQRATQLVLRNDVHR